MFSRRQDAKGTEYNKEIYLTYFDISILVDQRKGWEKMRRTKQIVESTAFPYTIYMKMTVHVNIYIW